MTDAELVAHFSKINERLDKIERTQGTFITDLEKDRGDLHDFTIEVARLGAIVEGVHKNQTKQTEKVMDQMEEVGSAIVDETKRLKNTIKEKKFIPFKAPGWITRFLNRNKGGEMNGRT